MEKRVDSLSHITESMVNSQQCSPYGEQPFIKSDSFSDKEDRTTYRNYSQEYPCMDFIPHTATARSRRAERYKSNIRCNNWQEETDNAGEQASEDAPRVSLSPPPSSFGSSKATSLSPSRALHHKLRLSTSPPPPSPVAQERRPLSMQEDSTKQHLFYSAASSTAYHFKSQPEPSTIYEEGAPSAKMIRSNAIKKRRVSPISKIAILRRRSETEFTKQPVKPKHARKTSYGGKPFSQELNFSTAKNKQNQGWHFDV